MLGVCDGVGKLLGVFEAVLVRDGVSVLEPVIDCVSPDDDTKNTATSSAHKAYIVPASVAQLTNSGCRMDKNGNDPGLATKTLNELHVSWSLADPNLNP